MLYTEVRQLALNGEPPPVSRPFLMNRRRPRTQPQWLHNRRSSRHYERNRAAGGAIAGRSAFGTKGCLSERSNSRPSLGSKGCRPEMGPPAAATCCTHPTTRAPNVYNAKLKLRPRSTCGVARSIAEYWLILPKARYERRQCQAMRQQCEAPLRKCEEVSTSSCCYIPSHIATKLMQCVTSSWRVVRHGHLGRSSSVSVPRNAATLLRYGPSRRSFLGQSVCLWSKRPAR